MANEKSPADVQGGIVRFRPIDLPTAPIAKIEELRTRYESLSTQVNLVTPLQAPDFIPAMYKVSLRAVVLSAEVDRGDVYKDDQFCAKGERAPTKVGLLKILQAAGGEVVAEKCRRVDDRKDPRYAETQMVIRLPMLDGSSKEFAATRHVDHRDGSDEIVGWSEKRLAQARKFTPELSETKALSRAIREGLALKQKYTEGELARPFVVPALVFDPDMSDPEIRRMVAARGLGVTDQLYGPAKDRPALVAATAPDEPAPAGEVIDVKAERVALHGTDNVDVALFGAPPTAPAAAPPVNPDIPEHLCACTHGCEKEIGADVAATTLAFTGRKLCSGCYPWNAAFKIPDHQGLRNMGFSTNYANLTGDQAIDAHRAWMADQAKKKGAGR